MTIAASPQTEPLPQGVHPRDNSVPWGQGGHEESPVPADTPAGLQASRGSKPWAAKPHEALGVFQRSSQQWATDFVALSANSGPREINGQKGRTSVTLWVPTTQLDGVTPVTIGVIVAPTVGEVSQGIGVIVNVGDSIEITTEADIWIGPPKGQTTGFCQYMQFINPAGDLGAP